MVSLPAHPATPAPPWYLRRVDLFRSCKTGEVIEATPRTLSEKLRIAAAGLLLGAPVVLAMQWFSRTWIPHYIAETNALAKVDPVEGARRLAEFVSTLFLVPVLAGIIGAIALTIQASRIVRAGRRPLPGATVRRRTEVVAGWWCARIPALIWGAAILACAGFAWVAYIQVDTMFWNGYLDRRVEHSSKAHLRTAVPKAAHASDLNETGVKP